MKFSRQEERQKLKHFSAVTLQIAEIFFDARISCVFFAYKQKLKARDGGVLDAPQLFQKRGISAWGFATDEKWEYTEEQGGAQGDVN